MIFREIIFNSAEYTESLKLREAILRAPLGTKLSADDISDEDKQQHFGLFNQSGLVACVVITPLDDTSVKLRQMTVSKDLRGLDIGKRLVQLTEDSLIKQGYKHIEMSARQTAAGFYKKLGYVKDGDEFLEMGIPHIKMRKNIKKK